MFYFFIYKICLSSQLTLKFVIPYKMAVLLQLPVIGLLSHETVTLNSNKMFNVPDEL